MANESLKILPLGGLGEVGKNMMVLETDEDIVVIDAGVLFPEDDMPGIDIVVSAGPDLGARVPVGAQPVIVGRGRDAHLQLTDMTVSRRHLEISATAKGIVVRVVGEAAPCTGTSCATVEAFRWRLRVRSPGSSTLCTR